MDLINIYLLCQAVVAAVEDPDVPPVPPSMSERRFVFIVMDAFVIITLGCVRGALHDILIYCV